MIYLTLFFSAFVSATLFPLGSEALFLYDINEGHNLLLLLLFATCGNVLGACLNYYFGIKGEDFIEEKKYVSKEKMGYYKHFFTKYGGYSLLLSWMPIIGDSITFIAGMLKYNFNYFLVLVTLAKLGRYGVLALGLLYFK